MSGHYPKGFQPRTAQNAAGPGKRLGIIGAGFIGNIHAECIAECPGASLHLVSDADPDAARELAARHGASVLEQPDQLIASNEIDAVIIAASTAAHGELARACARAGKPFLCEKPMDTDLASASATLRAVREAGIPGCVGFSRRFDHQYMKLQQTVRAGAIGCIETMHFTSRTQALPGLDYIRSSGGQLRDKGAHFFDLACWLAGERPVEILVMGGCLVEPSYAGAGDFDTAMILMRMASGGFASFSFGRYDERVELFGAGGRLDCGAPSPHAIVQYSGEHAITAGPHQDWLQRFGPSYPTQMRAFINELEDPTGSFPSVEDGFAAEAIATAGLQSMAERRLVEIDYGI